VIDFYNKHKTYLSKKPNRNTVIVHNIVILAMIKTHQIQTVNEFNQLFNIQKEIEYINSYDKKTPHLEQMMRMYEKIKQTIHQLKMYKSIILSLGFNIIENYDCILDVNGLKK
jgi:hypothetical protein